ncbi:copper amine oxidase N-terminal domain-containing protein [Paenibacillus rhizovicinus]|uniref:Copper amine oxidase N-terminal domain-containing protein n=1 Tax=Paenibacillus rhizovicinus TaxID=2704463 RepID=A0A6C0NZJ7_9BACL|nr:copper amine oxidase N-terminal domain-containing protein [Paenibacillus rhizovicinus]QHW31647.1 copper amine oxidase N-terminal domain-containing protein [Paenibacillus rhizovicinus]
MIQRRSYKLLLAAALLLASGSAGQQGTAMAAGSADMPAAADPSTAVQPMLDPGFGYETHFTHDLAMSLLASSPVAAYLPTRLPDSGWQYYGLKSALSGDGYAVTAFRTAKLQPVSETLPSAGGKSGVDPAAVLYELKAGTAAEAGLAVPQTAKRLLGADGWTYWADGASDTAAAALTAKFAAMSKPGSPVNGATGTVLAASAGSKTVYSASWTIDGSVYYSFVSYGSLADFTAMLTSFRPVTNLLASADVVLLPKEMQLNMQIGRGRLYEPYENRFAELAKAPAVYNGSVYLPLRDIATVIGGKIRYIGKEGAVYVSRDGDEDELKLDLRTGTVARGQEKLGAIKPIVKDGTTLVPLRFMTDQFRLAADYDAASKGVTVHANQWALKDALPRTSSAADLAVKVFTIGGPPFLYDNEKVAINTSHGYTNLKPPQGYNGLKYVIYEVHVPLIPGENELVLRDMANNRVLTGIPIRSTVKPEDIPFRYGGLVWFDGMDLKLKLTSTDGKAWPAGYAETSGAITIASDADFKALNFNSLQAGYQIGTFKSKIVSAPLQDGKLSYRLLLDKGPGTYEVTLYSPFANMDSVQVVSFIVVVPPKKA